MKASETKTENSVVDLIDDPSLHGKLKNERSNFYKAIEGMEKRKIRLFETIESEEYKLLLESSQKDFGSAEKGKYFHI